MPTLQPFIQPASVIAYLFTERLNNNQAFSMIESDIRNKLSKLFFDNPESEKNIMQEAHSMVFGKENLELFIKMIVLMVKYKNLSIVLFNYFDDVEKANDALEKAYQGAFANRLEFTYRYVEKLQPIPEQLEAYIDYERLAQDLFMNAFYAIEVGDRTHVFKRES